MKLSILKFYKKRCFVKTLIAIFLNVSSVLSMQGAEIWISPQGSDSDPGNSKKPKASLHGALRQARELRRLNDASVKDGITIYVQGGTYILEEPVFIRPEDSGTATSPTVIKAVSGEKPVLSGGIQVKDWKKNSRNIPGLPPSAKSRIWVADAPVKGGKLIDYRQLWVDDVKAVRARDVNNFDLNKITSWNKNTGVMGVPALLVEKFSKNPNFVNTESMEFVIHQMWAIANLRVKTIDKIGEEVVFTFQQPEARIQSEHPWPTPMMKDSVRSPFYLCNAIEFLDSPGEWFLDKNNRKLYYWPREGEDMKMATIMVPYLETLLQVSGSLDSPVSNIVFDGITFSHSTWLRPSEKGHVPLQAGMYLIDAYKLRPPGVPGNQNKGLENQAWIGRPSAAVQLKGVSKTAFENCKFEHLGSCGLDYALGTESDIIKGCYFNDIAGNGIQAGRFSDPGTETHLPYDPRDIREVCKNLLISNNMITDVSNEDWGCVGIAAGYVRGINIEHNEISEISYTGISLGWGWTKTVNCMRDNSVYANYIHHYAKHMYDVAGIYTLSAQPKTVIAENYIDSIYRPSYVHDPNHWFYLYTDEGSSFITVKDNWCPAEKFLKNANGPGNNWENNGPSVSDSIKLNAGLEPKYRYLSDSAKKMVSKIIK